MIWGPLVSALCIALLFIKKSIRMYKIDLRSVKRASKKTLADKIVGEPTLKKCFIKGDNRKVAGPIQTMLRFHP